MQTQDLARMGPLTTLTVDVAHRRLSVAIQPKTVHCQYGNGSAIVFKRPEFYCLCSADEGA